MTPQHTDDCDLSGSADGCPCSEPSGRDDPESISNLMLDGPPA